ncbi:hypothetical protein B4U80_01969, partial [Leptotrombidium deliense]
KCSKSEVTPTTENPIPDCDFYCKSDKKCIEIREVCDFKKDCVDGSDEINCGECEFNETFCNWTNEGDEQWLLVAGNRFKNYKLIPSYDEAKSENGSFLILQSSSASKNSAAILRSPEIGKTSSLCHLQFSYFNNFKKGSLTIQVRTADKVTPIFSAPYTNSTDWREKRLPLTSITSRFFIEFIGTGEYHKWIDDIVPIGIDNFKLINCTPIDEDKPKSLNCDFETDECGWSQLGITPQRLPWIRSNDFYEISEGYNISSDHTKGNGYFVYVQRPLGSNGTRAVYLSPLQMPTNNSCFNFWYRMFSRVPVTLELGLNPINGGYQKLVHKRNSQSNSWLLDSVNIQSDQKYRLMFIANIDAYSERKSLNQFFIALDDFSLNDGECKQKDRCDFEVESCDWKSEGWKRTKGVENNPAIVDHSTGTTSGHFMMATKFSTLSYEIKEKIPTEYRCLSFWSMLRGTVDDLFNVKQKKANIWEETAVDEIFDFVSGSLIDNGWNYARVNVSAEVGTNITFEANLKSKGSFFLLDDIVIADTPCPPVGSCDFEKDFCGWRNLNTFSNNSVMWLRTSGKTPSPYSGPLTDHTTKSESGFYLFVENHNLKNEIAAIESELLRLTPTICLQFYFHMYSKHLKPLNWGAGDAGSISVSYFNEESGVDISIDQSIVGENIDEWMLYRKTVNSLPRKYKIIITAKTGEAGDIAIDDILINKGSCEGEPKPRCLSEEFDCGMNEKVCIPKMYVCDFTEDCPNGNDEKINCTKSCDFENGDLCGWNVASTSPNFSWQIDKANTFSNEYLPSKDHTKNKNDGFIASVIPQTIVKQATARLNSNNISRSAFECVLELYYYCNMDHCPLEIIKIYPNLTHDLLWDPFHSTVFEKNDAKWRRAKAFIGHDENFKLSIVARQSHYSGFAIAIDDIKFKNCSLPKFGDVEEKCDDVNDFKCSNGHCIRRELICDYSNDCMDNSDEDKDLCKDFSGNCNFESECQFWRQGPEKQFNRWRGTISKQYTPKNDHTTRSKKGYYMSYRSFGFIDKSSEEIQILTNPMLISKVISHKSPTCRLRFWYNIIGVSNIINVYVRNVNSFKSMKLLATITAKDVNDFWIRQEINVLNFNEHFEVVMQAKVNSTGSVSIDDVSFSKNCDFMINEELPNPITAEPETTTEMVTTEETSTLETTTESLCPYGTTKCSTTQKCYTYEEKCNFVDDCGDNSDEIGCGQKCDFERKCDWFNAYTFNPLWRVNSGPSRYRIDGIGPKGDHTYSNGSGKYLITDNTKSFIWNKAILHSPILQSAGKRCAIQFAYYMHGTNGSRISMKVNSNNEKTTLWEVEDDVGDFWVPAQIPIGERQTSFFISFVTEFNFNAVIKPIETALDDIEFINCEPESKHCLADELMCNDKSACVKIWERCNGVYDCKDKSDEWNCKPTKGSCDFNDPNWLQNCQWKNLNADFEWSASTLSNKNNTGPQSLLNENDKERKPDDGDNVFMSEPLPNKFLYLNSTGHETGEKTAIATSLFNKSENVCHITYHYYLYGSPRIGPLRVYAKSENGGFKEVLAEYFGNHGPKWIAAAHVIYSVLPYRVVFEGVVGDPGASDIAVDEVRFSPNCKDGSIPVLPKNCTGFMCNDGTCIDSSLKCDCKQDCKDGSDEIGCDTSKCFNESELICQQKGSFSCYEEKNVCIYGIMVCDGINDCKNGEDERNCTEICNKREYYCAQKGQSSCRTILEACDKKSDCPLEYDESLCDVKKCPDNYCMNGGTCVAAKGLPYCNGCPDANGKRCLSFIPATTPAVTKTTIVIPASTKTPIADQVQSPERNSNIGIILGTIGGFALFVIIALLVVKYYKNRGSLNIPPITFTNPVYDLALDDLNTEHSSSASTMKRDAQDDPDDEKISMPTTSWKRYH